MTSEGNGEVIPLHSKERQDAIARHPAGSGLQAQPATTLLQGRYTTVEEYAEYTGKSPATVKRWCQKVHDADGPGRVVKVGRMWLIRWNSL